MRANSISTEELQDLLAAGQPVTVVDIRTPADREWSIPGGVQVDAYERNPENRQLGSARRPRKFPPGPVVTTCEMGRTAATATEGLRATGIEARANPQGGMRAGRWPGTSRGTTISGCEVVQVRRTGKGCLSYIVESDSAAVVIDASLDPDIYVQLLGDRGWRLVVVMDTHIHADHLSRSGHNKPSSRRRAQAASPGPHQYPSGAIDGDRIRFFGSAHLVALATPVIPAPTYLLDDAAAFTGDTLFLAGVGRPTSKVAPVSDRPLARLSYISQSAASLSCPRRRMLVMVQREVAERLCAPAGAEAYGAASVKVAYWATARIVATVPASVFVPRPKVESALADIRRRPSPAVDVPPEPLFRLVRTAFGQRRKMLRRSLVDVVPCRRVRQGRHRCAATTRRARHRRVGSAHECMAGGDVSGVVVVDAPAKLTLSLRITGVRDDGYHFIDAEMVTVDWHDTLTIDPASRGLTVDGPCADGVPLDESNLVAAALRHVGRTAAVHIHKVLPHGGGLGGGSADAAAVLRWAGYSDVEDAARLGADVAFCLLGGRARSEGHR